MGPETAQVFNFVITILPSALAREIDALAIDQGGNA
jgi:hypothetical protein